MVGEPLDRPPLGEIGAFALIPWTCELCGARYRAFLGLAYVCLGGRRTSDSERLAMCGRCVCKQARPGPRGYDLGAAGRERVRQRGLAGCVFTFRLASPGRPLFLEDFEGDALGPKWNAWWTYRQLGGGQELFCHHTRVEALLFVLAREYNRAGLEPPGVVVESRMPHYTNLEDIHVQVVDCPPPGFLEILGRRLEAHLAPLSTMVVDAIGRQVSD